MTRIRLVVTGRVEELALAPALSQIFPDASFSTIKKEAGTTLRLGAPEGQARAQFRNFVDEMLAAGDVERIPDGAPFDYVVVVDDLELFNADQPAVVTEHMACAVRYQLDALSSSAHVPPLPKGKNKSWKYLSTDEHRRAYLRERCSFHLLSPMVESLFYGEREGEKWPALERAKAVRDPDFEPVVTDIEQFATADQEYLTFVGDAPWTAGAAREPTWRARHPKHYLSFLCDPTGKTTRPYKEKEGGKAALSSLDWRSVVAPPQHACLVRSLLVDVADMVGVDLPFIGAGVQHPLTSLKSGGLLRNIP